MLAHREEDQPERVGAGFNQGSAARDNAERYLRDTVLFASVLFLVAIAQRFRCARCASRSWSVRSAASPTAGAPWWKNTAWMRCTQAGVLGPEIVIGL